MTAIQPGQEYLACRATPSMPGEHYTRIRVTSAPGVVSRKPGIVTVWADGSTSNPRTVNPRRLHASSTTATGQPRRTGYRLVRHADGSPA